MSNISRRDFMKTAGVMTLAVAASGVLAGCSTTTDDSKDKVVQTSATSATVGDYTVTVTSSKLYNQVVYKDGDVDKDSTVQKLAAIVAIKATKDSPEDIDVEISFDKTNISSVAEAASANEMDKVFGMKDKTIGSNLSSVISLTKAAYVTGATYADGILYPVIATVKKNNDGSNATPTLKIVIKDKTNYTKAELTVAVPTAVDIKNSDLT